MRHQPYLDERLDETRTARRQHDVTGKRVARTGAGGDTVHGADDRQRRRSQAAHQLMVPFRGRVPGRGRVLRLPLGISARTKLLAGTEPGAVAGEQDRSA